MNADYIVPLLGDRSTAVKLAVLGMISGAISWALVDFADKLNLYFQFKLLGLVLWPLSVYPGLVFGLIFGALLRLWGRWAWRAAMGYALAAVLGYTTAFHVTFYIVGNGFNSDGPLAYIVGGIPGGLAGSLVLGLLAKFLLRVPGRLGLRTPVAVGTMAGALLGLASFETHNGWGFLAFFVLWQGAYGASLAPMLRQNAGGSANQISGS